MPARAVVPWLGSFHVDNAGTTEVDNLLKWMGLALRNRIPQAEYTVVVDASGATDVVRGTALLAAVATARALSPTIDRRASVIIPPGRYDLGVGTTQTAIGGGAGDVGVGEGANHGLILDVQYVDLIGLDEKNTVITSQIATDSRGTVEHIASNVKILNLTIEGTGTITQAEDNTDTAAYFPKSGRNAYIENVTFRGSNGTWSTRRGLLSYNGTYKNCTAGTYAFNSDGGATGIFINCTASNFSFQSSGTSACTYIDCLGGESTFLSDGTTASKFINCVSSGSGSFLTDTNTSNTFVNCTAGGLSFVSDGTNTDKYIDCTAGVSSFTGTATGCSYVRCAAGASSLTTTGSFFDCSIAGVHKADTAP